MTRISMILILLVLCGVPAFAAVEIDVTKEELRFVELVNEERAKLGLSHLVVDPLLVSISRKHSREMAEMNYFSHTSPVTGRTTPMDRFLAEVKERPAWGLIGENLFYCSRVDVTRGHIALMNSPSHKANILEPRFERIGVGAFITPAGQFYITQTYFADGQTTRTARTEQNAPQPSG